MAEIKPRNQILFGAAYYDEYQPSSHLEYDFDLMEKAGFNVVRVGEGSWSQWEPEEEHFRLDWLEPVLDEAHRHHIAVVIGMPTFSVPRWLARKYPEVSITDASGHKTNFGFREEHNYSHPVFRYFSSRVMRKITERYRDHPAVIGWQVYNEPGLAFNYSDDLFEGFKDRLRHKYHSVENLNKAWGLVYWSHELSTWDDLWRPEGNGSPQYDLAWREYELGLTSEVVSWAGAEVRQFALPHQFTSACIALNRQAVDESLVSADMDIPGSNIYFRMQDALNMPDAPELPQNTITSGAWSLRYSADRSFAMKQQPFYVFETNGGPIGGPADNYPAWDGQWRQAAYQLISRGASMIEYWHWQALHYGTETYWGAVLPHDRLPGRVYQELALLGNELKQLGGRVVDLQPESDVVFLYSVKSKQALAYQPHHAADTSNSHRQRNPRSYDEIMEAFYQGAFYTHRQVRIVHDNQLVADNEGQWLIEPAEFAHQNPVLVAAGTYVCSDPLLAWLMAYVGAGGHLILGPKATYADDYARPRLEVKPALADDAAGCSYQEYSNIRDDLDVSVEFPAAAGQGARARQWIECLVPTTGRVLARAVHPHFSRFALIVTNEHGAGRVTTVGTVPNRALSCALFDWAVKGTKGWTFHHPSVTVSSAVNRSGAKLHFLFNWSWAPVTVELPMGAVRIGAEGDVRSSQAVLGAWDVHVYTLGDN
ncbi:beta-galactosidase [Sodalis ligni]|uniref:beta-galactosidase n=1 Tax=Sodalis ligni TaxID=2697027 RepID=A0A4V2Q2L7_9GAMM|nr:beta-galactosidase [Sodalis ligni]TCL03318.1 beta-galactosidase [Sodalis ligni]